MARLLVVDDEKMIGLALQRTLERAGHTVLLAQNGVDAVRVIKESHFDLCLVDLLMPEMGGAELLQWIVSSAPNTKVLMMTAYGDQGMQDELLKRGAISILKKPFDNILDIPTIVEKELAEGIR